jgi:Fibronectin type III domain
MMVGIVPVSDIQPQRSVTRGWLPRAILVFLLGVTAASLWARAEAHAAAPEAPEVEVTSRQASTASLRGVLNPGKEGEGGTYEFLYKASKTECEGANHAPASPGLSVGLEREEVFEGLSALESNTEYTVCLRVENTKGETALSQPVTFKTALPPETPQTRPATEVTGTTAKLNGVLNPTSKGEPGTYEFLYRQSATECAERGATPTTAALGEQGEAVSVAVTELLPATKYTYCLLARNGAEETNIGPPETFETDVAAPTIEAESFSNVTSSEATVTAEVNPGGEPATYWVEYEPGARTAEQSLPASSIPVGVQVSLTGLKAATEYRFRFLAHNEHGSPEGAPVTFTTSSSGFATQTLPDNRGYELVSPAGSLEVYDPDSEGLGEEDLQSNRPYRAATGGDAVTYAGEPPSSGEGGNGSEGSPFGNEYLAKRGPHAGASGWELSDITPLARNIESRYEAFSSDLSVGIFYDPDGGGQLPPLTEDAPRACHVLYARGLAGVASLFTNDDVQKPGFCGFEDEPISAGGNEGTASVPPYSQRLFETAAALTPESVEAPGEGRYDLYDSSGAQISPVNVLGGKPDPSAVFGGPTENPHEADLDNAISADGSRVFWSAVEPVGGERRPTALYAREDPLAPGASTTQIDEAQSGATGPSGDGQFLAASTDGSTVLFTDCNRLVEGSTADNSEGCEHLAGNELVHTGNDLYEYDFAKPAGHRLSDLTIDHTDPHGANVQGLVAASPNGEYVYFVAEGVLAENQNKNEETAQAGRPNLYLLHAGTTTFVATLAPEDYYLQGFGGALQPAGDWRPALAARTAEVTPDGHSLVFESQRSLTGYDNAVGGVHEIEVFLYNADAGRLSCVSCSPSGAHVVSGTTTNPGRGTYVPISLNNTFMHRWINETGTEVFFDTSQPLVPQDTNGRVDVYEWEREGNGSCPAGAPSGGCVYLLSGGTSSDQSLLVDASANGDNVFFTTRAQLVSQDRDDRVGLYDVRVSGGFPETSRACTGTGCQGVPPASPTFATPPSVTFGGTGNYPPAPRSPSKPKTAAEVRGGHLARALKACRAKHDLRRRKSCEAQAHKRYAPLRKGRKAASGRPNNRNVGGRS